MLFSTKATENFNQLPAAKKGFKKRASQQTFGPSYFVRALASVSSIKRKKMQRATIFASPDKASFPFVPIE